MGRARTGIEAELAAKAANGKISQTKNDQLSAMHK